MGLPEDVEKHKEKGNDLYKAGEFYAAIGEFDKAIQIKDAAVLRSNKAAVLTSLRRYPEAAGECARGVILDPSFERARTRLAALCVHKGALDGALAAAETQLKADPESASGKALVRLLRAASAARDAGNKAFQAGSHQEADSAYSEGLKAIETHAQALAPAAAAAAAAAAPGAAVLLCNRAAARAALGRHADALADSEAALAAAPAYLKAQLRRATALLACGEGSRALEAFASLRRRLPGDPALAKGWVDARALLSAGERTAAAGPVADALALEESAGVIHIRSHADYLRWTGAFEGLVVAKWCGPCKQVSPVIDQLALANPSVAFLKVDVDEQQETAAAEAVRSMPTFKFFIGGRPLPQEGFSGADANRVASAVSRLAPPPPQ